MASQNNFGSDPVGDAIGTPPTAPPITEDKGGFLSGLKQLGSGFDDTLSSPSRQLGIGLLGRLDPRLGLTGLLASGLFDSGLFGGK